MPGTISFFYILNPQFILEYHVLFCCFGDFIFFLFFKPGGGGSEAPVGLPSLNNKT